MRRRKYWIILFALLTLACFLLEMRLQTFGVKPNLTILPVFYIGLRHGPGRGVLFGALVGSIADSLSGHLLGPNLLSKGTVAVMASAITGGFFRWTPILGALVLFAMTWADGIISIAALSVFAEEPVYAWAAAKAMFVQASINAVFGVFLKPADEH